MVHGKPDGSLPAELLAEARRAVGRSLRAYRNARGLSQDEMGAYAGVHQSEWSRVEAGEVDPRLSWLLQAQHVFGLESIETLFGTLPTQRLLQGRDEDDAGA
jgi:predicted transcriptional regulator